MCGARCQSRKSMEWCGSCGKLGAKYESAGWMNTQISFDDDGLKCLSRAGDKSTECRHIGACCAACLSRSQRWDWWPPGNESPSASPIPEHWSGPSKLGLDALGLD